MQELIAGLLEWYKGTLDSGGYTLIALLMAMESTIIPIPSEVIIPPAAMMIETGRFSMFGITLAGGIGSWVGATIMYWGSRWAGRPLVLRYGKYFLIPESKVILAEQWAAKFGSIGVFFSRLLPVVRHLIGIPAGIVRIDFLKYSFYTLVGSMLWSAILCWLGVKAGQDEALMRGELHRVTLWAAGALTVLGAMYYFLVQRQLPRTATTDLPTEKKP
ncbi:MAG: DedA family protein [Limisphaerales bacterium]|jgi:membrane protein DedA with SNARE-associated domain|nr:DedA family protein [Verrucomicrobiota bacterium]